VSTMAVIENVAVCEYAAVIENVAVCEYAAVSSHGNCQRGVGSWTFFCFVLKINYRRFPAVTSFFCSVESGWGSEIIYCTVR
jgi:hypothetical protein